MYHRETIRNIKDSLKDTAIPWEGIYLKEFPEGENLDNEMKTLRYMRE